ncbi:NASP-related protein sim3 isoform X1 [Coffea eugenioides]|uniref:Uncharacterized protein isoform X1 n=1 Tax=Coffea arabica TaxID=13443 RepID=A0A6P6TJX8_COFAR|nr:NASP-related protein sim3 isoform X1 [Coffea arabica]XP_027151569.1 NASP-related protein sim3 isoform X1 [Coffea eugenioides]
MAEEAPNSDIEGPNVVQNQNSAEATIESELQGGTESTCNNAESSTISSGCEREKSLEYAEELMELGSKAAKERDYAEATDYYSRALEIRVAHFGELAPECVNAYYKYGCALLYKAQEEADPLGAVPKKESEVKADSDKDGSVESGATGEPSATPAASKAGEAATSSTHLEKENELETDGFSPSPERTEAKDVEEDEEETDSEDVAEADEDESDLDLAWKMLDVARAIVEKHSEDTMEKVDILSALAEVALEREDVETSLSDYLKALSILERLVEPDSRHIAELNFRLCLCLEIGSKPEEAIPYCKKAISICISRLERLTKEAKELADSTSKAADSESDRTLQHCSSTSKSVISATAKESEIETLSGLSDELEKKLEDLHQLVLNKKSLLSDLMYMMAAKDIEKTAATAAASVQMSSSQMGTANSTGGVDSSTVSTAHTNGSAGVTHLGVVGRGVKRVLMDPSTSNSNPVKKPSVEPSQNNTDGNAS